MGRGFFVTGTDTAVGKTRTALGLMAALQLRGYAIAGMKPVACGCARTEHGLRNEDALLLQAQSSVPLPYAWVNPCALAVPTAPHIAAAEESRTIRLEPLLTAFRELTGRVDCVVVEGVGGWKVPLDATQTTADLARALGLPVIVVTGIRLGCLNHTLLTCDSIERAGLALAGWVANVVAPESNHIQENIEALSRRVSAPLLGVIPYLPSLDLPRIVPRIVRALDLTPLLPWI
jgi:dethiobiotin synthetase